MSAPLLLLVLGGLLAFAAFIVRGRGGIPWAIAAGGAALLSAVALGIVLEEPFDAMGVTIRLAPAWTFLGRSLLLRPDNRALVSFVFLSGTILLVAGWLSDAPRRMASVGLLVLLALAAAMMVQPFVFSPTFIDAAAILACLLVVRPGRGPGRASPRLMVSYTLGMMAILVAGWFIEIGGATASPASPARVASVLLGLGLAILVATPPFHTWLTASSEESHPLVFVFVAVALQTAGLFLLVDALGSYAWMRADPLVFTFVEGVGVLMVGLGGLWCFVERRAPRMIAYALLVDFGIALLALSTASAAGYRIALGMAAARPLSLAVWGAGFANLYAPEPDRGAGGRSIRKGAAAAALLGAMSLAGFPLTAGFAGRWMTLASARGENPVVVAGVLFGIAATWLAIGRWGWSALRAYPVESQPSMARSRRIVLTAGMAGVILLGILPGWLFGWALPALAGLLGA